VRSQHRHRAPAPTHRQRPRRPPLVLLIAPGGLALVALTVLAVAAVLGLTSVPATAGSPTAPNRLAAASEQAAPTGTSPAAPDRRANPVPGTTAPVVPVVVPETRIEDRDQCPPQFVACVDLRTQRAWLQRGTTVTFGPTPFMPGTQTALAPPGPDSSATPTGAFTVLNKNATQVSTEFNEPMPNAVFFAPGGIAFHQGSLTTSSHGCVHLGPAAAAAFFDQLQIGDPVLVL